MIRRILAAIVGLTLVVLAVHDIPLAAHLRSVERDRLTTTLERDAFTLAGIVEERVEEIDMGATSDVGLLQDLSERYGDVASSEVFILDRTGSVIAATDPDQVGTDRSSRAAVALAVDGVRSSEIVDDPDRGRVLDVAVPVLSGPTTIGTVEFVRAASEIDRRVSDRLRGIFLAASISLALAAVIGWVLARTLTEPLRRLRRATAAIAQGELSTRAEVPPGPSEIRALAEDFNDMVGRLERALAEQRRFAGDASHQLRTPITTLGLRIDQLIASGSHDDETRTALESARGELRRMEQLVEGLLALARAGGSDAPLRTIDAAAVVRERAEQWDALAGERGVRLRVEVPATLPAIAVDGALDQIVDNYIDNALEVAPVGSELVVRAEVDGDDVVVTVVDAGPGLSDDDLERAFERFWRGSYGAVGGSGVGLAIVARLAAASRGRVELRHAGSGAQTGIAAIVRLRSARATPDN